MSYRNEWKLFWRQKNVNASLRKGARYLDAAACFRNRLENEFERMLGLKLQFILTLTAQPPPPGGWEVSSSETRTWTRFLGSATAPSRNRKDSAARPTRWSGIFRWSGRSSGPPLAADQWVRWRASLRRIGRSGEAGFRRKAADLDRGRGGEGRPGCRGGSCGSRPKLPPGLSRQLRRGMKT